MKIMGGKKYSMLTKNRAANRLSEYEELFSKDAMGKFYNKAWENADPDVIRVMTQLKKNPHFRDMLLSDKLPKLIRDVGEDYVVERFSLVSSIIRKISESKDPREELMARRAELAAFARYFNESIRLFLGDDAYVVLDKMNNKERICFFAGDGNKIDPATWKAARGTIFLSDRISNIPLLADYLEKLLEKPAEEIDFKEVLKYANGIKQIIDESMPRPKPDSKKSGFTPVEIFGGIAVIGGVGKVFFDWLIPQLTGIGTTSTILGPPAVYVAVGVLISPILYRLLIG